MNQLPTMCWVRNREQILLKMDKSLRLFCLLTFIILFWLSNTFQLGLVRILLGELTLN